MNEGMISYRPGSAGRVIVVGAGPVGLTLACELALAGVPCRVLERRPADTAQHRVVGLHGWTMGTFDVRGRADALLARSSPVGLVRVWPDRLAEYGPAGGRFPGLNVMAQSTIEEMLSGWVAELGVEVIRGVDVIGLDQDERGVSVRVRSGDCEWREAASYVVGCDGGDSSVRQLVDVPLVGEAYDYGLVMAEVQLGRPPADDAALHIGPGGAVLSLARGGGWHDMSCVDTTRRYTGQPPCPEELRATLHRLAGRDMQPGGMRMVREHPLHKRLAARYRVGRVLLAGDAAHQHSPIGGHGINLSLDDAVNLGWKLAAVVHGWAPAWLLDSYERERRLVAEDMIRNSDRASRMLHECAVRGDGGFSGLRRLVGVEPTQQIALVQRSGTGVRYVGARGGGPFSGRRAPDVNLFRLDGRVERLYELLRDGRFLVVDLGSDAMPVMIAKSWSDRVQPVVANVLDPDWLPGVTALIIRPDGYVAWSTGAVQPLVRARLCRDALVHWCGPADRNRVPGGGFSRLPVRGLPADAGAAGRGAGYPLAASVSSAVR